MKKEKTIDVTSDHVIEDAHIDTEENQSCRDRFFAAFSMFFFFFSLSLSSMPGTIFIVYLIIIIISNPSTEYSVLRTQDNARLGGCNSMAELVLNPA